MGNHLVYSVTTNDVRHNPPEEMFETKILESLNIFVSTPNSTLFKLIHSVDCGINQYDMVNTFVLIFYFSRRKRNSLVRTPNSDNIKLG